MTGMGLLAVGLGAVAGAWLRWVLGLLINSRFPAVPPGTLAANLIGAFVVGAAVSVFTRWPGLPPEWRLFIITGFCGGLTTFSTFSAEITSLLQQGRLAMMAGAIVVHVGGSLAMTLLGIASVQWLAGRA